MGERLAGDAYAYGAVLSDEVGGKVDGTVEDEGGGTDGTIDNLPRNIGHLTDIALQSGIAIDKTNQGL